jgi:hypothetical protein
MAEQSEEAALEMFTDHYKKMWKENLAFLREAQKQEKR